MQVRSKKNSQIELIGLDDIHSFSQHSMNALNGSDPQKFSILAVHSPEAFEAADCGINLSLRTYSGGQICLPDGTPLVTHSQTPKHLSRGFGIGKDARPHSSGIGTSGVPYAYSARKAVILTQKQK